MAIATTPLVLRDAGNRLPFAATSVSGSDC